MAYSQNEMPVPGWDNLENPDPLNIASVAIGHVAHATATAMATSTSTQTATATFTATGTASISYLNFIDFT
jgi:hypothetical protein